MSLSRPVDNTELSIPYGTINWKQSGEPGAVDLGEVKPFTATISSEKAVFPSARGPLIEEKGALTTKVTRAGSATIYTRSLANIARFWSGTLSVVAQASGAYSETITARPGMYSELGVSSSVPTGVRSITGVAAAVVASTAWVADTVTALGDIRIPTVANDHWYFAEEIAGDFKTDPTTEPTWPTNGGTVVDDAVTWRDGGLIALTVDVDYEIDLTDAEVYWPESGALYTAYSHWPSDAVAQYIPVAMTGTKSAVSRQQVVTGDAVSLSGRLKIRENSPAGNNRIWIFPDCTLTPNGDMSIITDGTDYVGFQFDITINAPSSGAAVYCDGQPYTA
jgi:hypothetical protein